MRVALKRLIRQAKRYGFFGFIPQREMEVKMSCVPEEVNELVYEDEWEPLNNSFTATDR